MSPSNANEFAELTLQLRDHYRLIAASFAELSSREGPLANAADLDNVGSLLDEVKTIESRLKPVRTAFQAAGNSVPPELKPVIDETIQIVMQLIPKITEMEQSAVDSREKLAPHIHAGVRAVQMQNAYSRGR